MVTSLKRKNIQEVIYLVVISSLLVSSLICAGIDFIYSQTFTWSLIVISSCLMASVIATIIRYGERRRLLKSIIATTVLLIPLLLAIYRNTSELDLALLFSMAGIWVVFCWVMLSLWLFTSVGFWGLSFIALAASLIGEWATIMLAGVELSFTGFLLRNMIEILLTILCLACSIAKTDRGKMDSILTPYRKF